MDALSLFSVDHFMYKQNDYRCLKPSTIQPPERWPYYEMEGFRAAKTEDDLEKVKEIKYDKNFFNFEDPKVFRGFTIKPGRRKLWRKTYGFDFASTSFYPTDPTAGYQCIRYCYQAEHAKFANQCREKGGFFKCAQAK